MRFELPPVKKLTLETRIPVRWGDMDVMGHVNNAVYFRYLEVARLEWLYHIGAPPNPNGEGPVVVNAFCNFLKQVEYPGELIARHYVANPGRSSFDCYITLEKAEQPGVICAEGGSKTVWVKDQKSVPLPDWLRALVS